MRVIERLAWRIQWVIEQTGEGLKKFFDVILTWREGHALLQRFPLS